MPQGMGVEVLILNTDIEPGAYFELCVMFLSANPPFHEIQSFKMLSTLLIACFLCVCFFFFVEFEWFQKCQDK